MINDVDRKPQDHRVRELNLNCVKLALDLYRAGLLTLIFPKSVQANRPQATEFITEKQCKRLAFVRYTLEIYLIKGICYVTKTCVVVIFSVTKTLTPRIWSGQRHKCYQS